MPVLMVNPSGGTGRKQTRMILQCFKVGWIRISHDFSIIMYTCKIYIYTYVYKCVYTYICIYIYSFVS